MRSGSKIRPGKPGRHPAVLALHRRAERGSEHLGRGHPADREAIRPRPESERRCSPFCPGAQLPISASAKQLSQV